MQILPGKGGATVVGSHDSVKSNIRFRWNQLVRRMDIDGPPVFIVGCGHSGTSLMLAVLDTHSRLYAVPYESFIAGKNDEQGFRAAMREFEWQAIAAGKHRWVEKTPKHIYHVENILGWCPDAQILVVIRDGRDVAYSFRSRTGDLQEGIQLWVDDNL
ncbi:MAG: sulfotransferase family protein, partial [Anaerolineales bacterium]